MLKFLAFLLVLAQAGAAKSLPATYVTANDIQTTLKQARRCEDHRHADSRLKAT